MNGDSPLTAAVSDETAYSPANARSLIMVKIGWMSGTLQFLYMRLFWKAWRMMLFLSALFSPVSPSLIQISGISLRRATVNPHRHKRLLNDDSGRPSVSNLPAGAEMDDAPGPESLRRISFSS